MTPNEFAIGLMRDVVDENATTYRELFDHTAPSSASDPYWRSALGLYASLSGADKEIFFAVIRQVMIDTTSNILGVIDGVNALQGASHEFTLRHGPDTLQGDLQNYFLIEDEKARSSRA